MNFKTFAVFTVCVGLVYGYSESLPCRTPENKNGECIPLTQCASLQALANKTNKSNAEKKLLMYSRCGYVEDISKVCCSKPQISEVADQFDGTCLTPYGESGQCVSILTCPHIRNLLRPPVPAEYQQFVRNSKCRGPDKYNVCCGPPPSPIEEDPDECEVKMTAFPPKPLLECCGEWTSLGDKIVGGLNTTIYEHPWVVNIEYRINNNCGQTQRTELFCGGVLISGKYILTAAHCIAGALLDIATPTIVRLGDYDITHEGKDCMTVSGGGIDCNRGAVRIEIEKTIPHPKYITDNGSKKHDIGLIRLKSTAPYTDFIRPICLPTKDLTRPENTPRRFTLDAVGWGATDHATFSNVKLQVNVPFVSWEKCQPAYNNSERNIALWKGQFCAGGQNGADTCKGDSGGPLVYENRYRLYEVIGIISFGPSGQCGLKDVPGVNTNVYEYLDWIRSTIVE